MSVNSKEIGFKRVFITTLKSLPWFIRYYVVTVQLGYCDSDVAICLLFWNMPIVQDGDAKFPYKRYRYYQQAF